MTTQDLLDYCISEINHLNSGEVFQVRDLFQGYKWRRLPRASRITLGTLFFNYASNTSKTVKVFEKSAQGQQRYQKI